MPKLKGSDLGPHATKVQPRVDARADEIVVGCPLVDPCGWETIRPLHAAHSAQVAHRIAHDRGLR